MARKKVTSKELIRSFGTMADVALQEPVFVTKNGRERLVLMSIEKFAELQSSGPDGESHPTQAVDNDPQ